MRGATTLSAAQTRRGELTDRQRQIWKWMIEFQRDHGKPPTIRQTCKAFDIRSPNGLNGCFAALVRKGYATRAGYSARGCRAVVPGGREPVTADCVGGKVRLLAGGVPLEIDPAAVAGLVGELVAAEAEALGS